MKDALYPNKLLSTINQKMFFKVFNEIDNMRYKKSKLPKNGIIAYAGLKNNNITLQKVWPENIFIPNDFLYIMIENEYYKSFNQMLPREKAYDLAQITTCLASWRPTQDIISFDNVLLKSLRDMSFSGNLPTEIFNRLPAWCLYFDIDNLNINDDPCHGFFSFLDYNAKYDENMLALFFACYDGGIIKTYFPLDCSLQESLDKSNSRGDYYIKITDDLILAINAVIFICTYGLNDCTSPINSKPEFPMQRKTKKGWRIIPPDQPKIRNIGKQFGDMLRQAESSYTPGTGSSKKPHVRRAHWHSYWTGARKDDDNRKLIVKWLHPMIVGGLDKCNAEC